LLLSKRVDGWKKADQRADGYESFYRNNKRIKKNGRRECGECRMGLPHRDLLDLRQQFFSDLVAIESLSLKMAMSSPLITVWQSITL